MVCHVVVDHGVPSKDRTITQLPARPDSPTRMLRTTSFACVSQQSELTNTNTQVVVSDIRARVAVVLGNPPPAPQAAQHREQRPPRTKGKGGGVRLFVAHRGRQERAE